MRTTSFNIPKADDKVKLKETAGNRDFLGALDCREKTDGLRTIKRLNKYTFQHDMEAVCIGMISI